MTDWKKYKLGNVVDLKRGYDLPQQHRQSGKVPIYSSAGLSGYHSESKVKGPGVVTGRYGTLGEVFYTEQDYWPHNTTLYVKDFKGNYPKFIYYFLQTLGFNNQNDKTSVPGLNRNHLHELDVYIPDDISIQTRIASILSALDDKIELNRRMNHTLEQMAQALFKKYFVTDIDPDNLPEGWRWGTLGEMIELAYGKSLKEGDRKGGKYPVVGSSGIVGSHSDYLAEGNGIVVGRKGNAGSVIWIHDNFFPIDTTFYVLDLLDVTGKYFYYLLLKTFDFGSLNSDSAVPGLNRNEALNQDSIIPEVSTIKGFNKLVAPLFEKLKCNEKEINSLTKIRDSLLPKLMNGDIEVS